MKPPSDAKLEIRKGVDGRVRIVLPAGTERFTIACEGEGLRHFDAQSVLFTDKAPAFMGLFGYAVECMTRVQQQFMVDEVETGDGD